jgi:SNF2 family DNA or RNA helicase
MSNTKFEQYIENRMERFRLLLKNANFDFKDYQYEGVKWCITNELRPNPPENCRGGIIADEMGLGKTIMMIGTMFVNYLPQTLIVVPPVLIQQWYNEIYKTAGHKALLFYGSNKKQITQNDIQKVPIILTTYNTLIQKDCLLKQIIWNRVIFDEAHHLRNSNTERFRNCNTLKARIRWLVTGTPVQNKQRDFKNLCSVAGIKRKLCDDDNAFNKNFLLRRTKQSVGIDLQSAIKTNYIVNWKNNKEMKLSQEIHSLLPNQTYVSTKKGYKLAECFGEGGVLTALLRARQSCVFPALMRKQIETFSRYGMINHELLEALNYTSKLDAVVDLMLQRKDNGKGKIVFCHFHKEIDIISERLLKGGMAKVVRYDGRNSGGKNLQTLSQPADALVFQIQTGCEGLNLQHHFSEIYFVSPHWNPFVEEQAIARCHRIGQKESVHIFKFEMSGFNKNNDNIDTLSLEKYINMIQDNKRTISDKILNIEC